MGECYPRALTSEAGTCGTLTNTHLILRHADSYAPGRAKHANDPGAVSSLSLTNDTRPARTSGTGRNADASCGADALASRPYRWLHRRRLARRGLARPAGVARPALAHHPFQVADLPLQCFILALDRIQLRPIKCGFLVAGRRWQQAWGELAGRAGRSNGDGSRALRYGRWRRLASEREVAIRG